MKKTLVILAHPDLNTSRMNKAWKDRLLQENAITVHDLYTKYPDGKIDVAFEQRLLLEHERIVFQFPLYWYSSPSLLKEWQDAVLAYGWAYGSQGTKLHGKEFMLTISTGGPQAAYQAGGFNLFSMSELTKPFQAMANLTGMRFLPTFTTYGVRTLTDDEVNKSAEDLLQHIKNA
ncbi:NAD(P)H-dependent oxidoreductase [Priestia koreensis]|uniref:NAD(P)H-dependent oxidoreductase n=1 Tax=Priestia koreensis TaxID=284581 RepID=UPI001F591F44|nr:NAD(P)H-dependent oxidoreductase [Priestia koreensis]UNL86839.1 NAD(P)H-dependent oxidoreductase [Priestia koreensis]